MYYFACNVIDQKPWPKMIKMIKNTGRADSMRLLTRVRLRRPAGVRDIYFGVAEQNLGDAREML